MEHQRKRRVLGCLAALAVLSIASEAFAWGPATHARIAADVLQVLPTLTPALGILLGRHARSYIFGNIAADVVFAKRMSRVKQFCHHWSTGFRLLEASSSETDQAFALGYLSHLAADTVAHGKYVPRQLSVTRTTLNFGHLYWEMRADALLDRATWRQLEEVIADTHECHHRVLRQHLTATLLPYPVNRRLFDGINRLVLRRYWLSCMHFVHRNSRWDLSENLVAEYRDESVERVLSVLMERHRSPVLREDPNGTMALHEARLHRRAVRRLELYGYSTQLRISEATAALAPRTRPGNGNGPGPAAFEPVHPPNLGAGAPPE